MSESLITNTLIVFGSGAVLFGVLLLIDRVTAKLKSEATIANFPAPTPTEKAIEAIGEATTAASFSPVFEAEVPAAVAETSEAVTSAVEHLGHVAGNVIHALSHH
jgi:hypothetical protein